MLRTTVTRYKNIFYKTKVKNICENAKGKKLNTRLKVSNICNNTKVKNICNKVQGKKKHL